MRSLGWRAALGTTMLVALVGACLFVGAGTLGFWQAWAFLVFEYATMTAANTYFLKTAPDLLEHRLVSNRETDPVQRVVKPLMSLVALALFVVAGLDRRCGWSAVPLGAVIAGQVGVALGALVIFLVMRENRFAAVVVEIQAEQRVITTGPYRWVRHPMYFGALLQAGAAALALGSYWAELVALAACAVVVARLLAEERLLGSALPGYTAYAAKTPHRLVPGLW
jgi:protein-S-isoprenylcysteine O-methyltransferase Ste14